MQIVIELPDDKIPTKQCYKDVLIKFVDKQVCEVTMIGQIPSEDDMGLFFDVLPEGHGRLIDADALYADLTFPTQQFAKAFHEILDDAPTMIIPAEKDGEEDEKH